MEEQKRQAVHLRCPRCKRSHIQTPDEQPSGDLGIFIHMCLYCDKIFGYEEQERETVIRI